MGVARVAPSPQSSGLGSGKKGVQKKTSLSQLSGEGTRPLRRTLFIVVLRYVRAFLFLVNLRMLIMAALACTCVYLCQSQLLDFRWKMDFSILSVGTVFPLVFAIQQAFSRREQALRELALLKAQLIGIYYCNRDWDVIDGVDKRDLGNDVSPHAVQVAQLVMRFLFGLKLWLVTPTPFESESEYRLFYGTAATSTSSTKWVLHLLSAAFWAGKEGRDGEVTLEEEDADAEEEARDPHWEAYYKMYDSLNDLSQANEALMKRMMCTKGGEAGLSRLAAYVSRTAECIEVLRYLRDYRTPYMLRYVNFTLIVVSIFLASPYFAFQCIDSRWETDTTGGCPAGYVMAILFVLVTMTLYHVQVALENPFDGLGLDDVFVDMDREFAIMLRRYIKSRKLRELEQDSEQWFEQVVGLGAAPPETQQQQQQTQQQKLKAGAEAVVSLTSSPKQGGPGGAGVGKATERGGSGKGTVTGPAPAAEGRWAGSLDVL